MDTRQLENFLLLCETLNYRKAAEQANIVQPALSRQIQVLEHEVGAILFQRTKRTVTLTPAGEYFKKEVNRVLQDLNKTITQTVQVHRGEAGEIRVTHSSSAMNTVVPSFLVKLKQKWPGLKTLVQEASNNQQIEMMLTRKTDLGIAPNILLPPEIKAKVLYRENFVLVLPNHHRLAKRKQIRIADLRNEVFVLPQLTTGIGYMETILQICQQYGFKPNVAHESTHAVSVLRLVEAGLGISIEPLSSLRGIKMNIKQVELKNLPQKAEMMLFWLREREDELMRFIKMF